jgi:hypothetical protein
MSLIRHNCPCCGATEPIQNIWVSDTYKIPGPKRTGMMMNVCQKCGTVCIPGMISDKFKTKGEKEDEV